MMNTQDTPTPRQKKKLTLMFFFASDNTLSPSTLPQLKAIKAAGSQDDTNVLVYFDPNEMGAPTRVFEINRNTGQTPSTNGNSDGPVVSVLFSDYVSPNEIGRQGPESARFANSLQPRSDQLKADTALQQFLSFCREAYPAQHYMLFLVGHGLVVGRDAFLPDDNPESAIGLRTLGGILEQFSDKIREQNEVLELIAMHSCSMSAVEVAYELKGKANYMLASQGLSFVGSWPYRQLLMKIYHDVAQPGALNVLELIKAMHILCIQYSVDFMNAGYSSDMCLCSLDPQRIQALTEPISKLSQALQSGVAEPRCRDLIVLAHWKSQSYWQETYTDLYDFCFCLSRLCQEQQSRENTAELTRGYDMTRLAILEACAGVMNKLKPENGTRVNGPVVLADYVGSDVQYSHGLSIYFPWSRPLQDENDHVIDNYETYAFTTDVSPQTWFRFLDTYFERTQRPGRLQEENRANNHNAAFTQPEYRRLLGIARQAFPEEVALGSRDFVSTSALEGKVSPPDASGGACSCASTKNYSRVFSMSPGVASVFDSQRPHAATVSVSAGSSTGGGASPPRAG